MPTQIQPPKLPDLPVLDWAYDMSPDGGSVLYRHRDSTGTLPGGVYLLKVSDTLNTTSIFPNSSFIASDCRFSPDGLKIAYTRNFREDIYVRNIVTGEDTQVTFTYGNSVTPDWDPSGRYIVYSRVFHDYNTPDSTAGIHIVDTETLTDTAFRHSGEVVFGASPRWSPDSLTIVFYTQGIPDHIITVTVDGSQYRDLTPSDRRNNNYPVWINRGTSLLFESYSPSSFNVHETHVVRADGTGRAKLPFDVRYVIGFAAVATVANLCAYTGPDSTGNYYVLLLRQLNDATGVSTRQLTTGPMSATGSTQLAEYSFAPTTRPLPFRGSRLQLKR
jgi:Tol biopolymer transport system component